MSEVRVVLHDCLPLNSAVASHSRPENFSDATAQGSQSEGSIRMLDTGSGAKRKFKFSEYLDFMLCSSVGLFFFLNKIICIIFLIEILFLRNVIPKSCFRKIVL